MSGRWLTPAQLADVLGVTRRFIYDHADELGARRLGAGEKAPIRFLLDEVLERTACVRDRRQEQPASRTVEPNRRPRRTRSLGTSVELLPVKGATRP